jgi:hypothetical protein
MLNKDSFSNGQIDSKLWLCRELENLGWESDLTHIYGGWYGVLAFLLLTREKFVVNRINSFDIDPECESMADMINNNYVFKEWKFKAHTADCNTMISNADLIINTSSEHFETMDWFDNIKSGTRVIIQGNDMDHDDHVVHSDTLEKFIEQYPLSEINYQGELEFVYPDWNFRRYMLIGKK